MAQNDRLELLKRENSGRRLLPKVRARLAAALNVTPETLDFLPLKDSDKIRAQVLASFPPRNELERASGAYPFFRKVVADVNMADNLLPENPSNVFVIIPPAAETIGILRLPTATVNRKWKELLRTTSDGFILVDETLSNSYVIDTEKDKITGEETLVLAAWGTQWSNALRAF